MSKQLSKPLKKSLETMIAQEKDMLAELTAAEKNAKLGHDHNVARKARNDCRIRLQKLLAEQRKTQ